MASRRSVSRSSSTKNNSSGSIEFVAPQQRRSSHNGSVTIGEKATPSSAEMEKLTGGIMDRDDSKDDRRTSVDVVSASILSKPPHPSSSSSSSSSSSLSFFIVQVALTASLGGILFGYDLGIIAGALPSLTATFALSSSQQEAVVSTLYIGGGVGATLGGSLCDAAGRRKAILLTDVVFGVAALVLYAAPTVTVVILGRILVGFAVAVSGIADVSYLHELAPPDVRGAMVSVNEACISLGFLLAFCVAHWVTYLNNNSATVAGSGNEADGDSAITGSNSNEDDGWRIMFGVSGLVAMLQFAGMWNMPESPAWLKQQGRHEEHQAALLQIQSMSGQPYYHASSSETQQDEPSSSNDNGEPPTSASHIMSPTSHYEAVPETTSATATSAVNMEPDSTTMLPSTFPMARPNRQSPYYYIYYVGSCFYTACRQFLLLCRQVQVFVVTTAQHYQRQGIIALFLSITQQLSGQTNVLSYAPILFAGVSKRDDSAGDASVQGWATLTMGMVKFLVTLMVILRIESVGRRCLLLWGMGTIALGLLLLSIAFASVSTSQQAADAGAAATDSFMGGADDFYWALAGVLLVVSGYSMSFGPLTWLLTSELFPVNIRGRALGTSTIVTYGTAFLATSTFLTAQEWIGASAVFALYLFITCLGWVFAYRAIPDTGDKNAQEIERLLDDMPWWRRDTVVYDDEVN